MPSWHSPLSTESQEAAAFYLEGLDRYLTILPASGRSFCNAFEADPTFGIGAAALAVTATAVGELALARKALAAARDAVPNSPAMSQSHIGAVDAILTLPNKRAVGIATQHLATYPADVFVLAMTLNALHSSGERDRRQVAVALLDRALTTGTNHFAVPSLRSVIAADLGQLDQARADAQTGLAANPRSAHAAHGMAHVYYETRDHEAGLQWLSSWTADFDPRASGLHLSWHLALHDLALGDVDRLLERYDDVMRPYMTSSQYVDTVDILWRMQLAGIDVDERFSSLLDVVPATRAVRGTSLSRLQSVVALAGASDEDGLRTAVQSLAARTTDEPCQRAVLPIARALLAIVASDIAGAAAHLESVDGELVAVAASNAQLDLVSDTLSWCYRRLGQVPPSGVFLLDRVSPGSSARATGDTTAPRGRAGRFSGVGPPRTSNIGAWCGWAGS